MFQFLFHHERARASAVDTIQALRVAFALARPAARSARASRNLRTALLFEV